MPELTLRLRIDPVTGKKTVVADYHSDVDALPDEHEEEHRRLVRKLVEGEPLDGDGPLVVDRETAPTPELEATGRVGVRSAVEQKNAIDQKDG